MLTDTLREALDALKRDSLTSCMEEEMDKYPLAEDNSKKSEGMRQRKKIARSVDIDDDISDGLCNICSHFLGT